MLACPEFIVIGHYTIDLLESSVHGLLQSHGNVPVCLFDLKKIYGPKGWAIMLIIIFITKFSNLIGYHLPDISLYRTV